MKRRRLEIGVSGLLLTVFLLAVISLPVVKANPLLAEFDCSAQSSIPVDECGALVAIYVATGGENWINKEGWLEAPDPCSWHGVSCSEGKVVALDLYSNNLTGTLPLEIGGFPDMKTLTINGNPLSGPIPLTITFMDLDLFHFHNTSLCEPADPTFQDWLSQIVYRLSSGVYCATLQPTTTPDLTKTEAAANLPWPQQTLTALAADTTSGLAAFTPEPTPTKYYTLKSPTPTNTAVSQSPSDSAGTGSESYGENVQPTQDSAGFLSNIPRGWLIVLAVPVVLIIIGVLLEMRDRRRERKEKRPSPLEYGDIEERL